jgi:hypothetical protein
MIIVDLFASRAKVYEQLSHGVQRDICHSRARAEAVSLYQHPQDCGAFDNWEAIHALKLNELLLFVKHKVQFAKMRKLHVDI